ncbi:MAG TPA: nuclear transport factor 2 family protein [Candidatus Acidoferrum sp.]|nr:nuclear transport factor 2 family protein [Candidatus Acidoferrum sp.]
MDKDKDRDRDQQVVKPPGFASSREAEPANSPALDEIYQRLNPEMRRPKPDQESIAAALQAMQRLTMETDSEAVAEESTVKASPNPATCGVCGHRNREGNKYCGACGLLLGAEMPKPPARPTSPGALQAGLDEEEFAPRLPLSPAESTREIHPVGEAPSGSHHYHHHYHHYYFQGAAGEAAASAPRANTGESLREADRMRLAAAAKGEPMSRSEAAVRRLTQEWVLACNTRQLDELIELYAADALVLRSNLPPIRGAMAVREFFFASLEAGLGEVALDPVRVEVSGDLAHEVGRYTALVPGTAGKRREERGKYLWVFAKQSSGDWKLLSECWSSDLTLSGAESDVPKPVAPQTRRGS